MKRHVSIFILLACWLFLPASSSIYNFQIKANTQKVVIIMMDGFGEEYYRAANMPMLNNMEKTGIYKVVPSLIPSVTNLNNASICTGELPNVHGITGNSYYDLQTGTEEFMEDSSLLLSPTIFQRAKLKGLHSALFSSKKKTTTLLSRGADLVLSPETASEEWKKQIGEPPSIYSREVNYWLLEAALYSMKKDTSISLFYIHTTDYPMHTWAPTSKESKEHLEKMDYYLERITEILPDAIILITADHTVNHKTRCIDLEKACTNRKAPVKIAISAERDKYFKHHRGFGGTSYVYLNDKKDIQKVTNVLKSIEGVEQVLTRKEVANKFHLMPERIGDIVVLGDRNTVFGNLDNESENLPENYRTHGSVYEASVPLFVFNAHAAPAADYFISNYRLAAWLYR